MANAQYGISLSIGGKSIFKSVTHTADNAGVHEVSLAAAEDGTLTTRTSDTVGEITMGSASHTITTGMTIDIFWSGGRQYGVTVGTVSGTAVPISGGTGDILPSTSTALTVDEQVVVNSMIDGDNVSILGVKMEIADTTSTAKGSIDMQDSGSASINQIDLTANQLQVWDIAGGVTNDFTGNVIETSHVSNGDSSNAATLYILFLQDSTTA